MILCGKFVFASTTAPIPFSISTRTASRAAGAKARPEYPSVVSEPWTSNWSLSVMGIPCRGPIGVEWWARWASSSFARRRASLNRTSVRQLV